MTKGKARLSLVLATLSMFPLAPAHSSALTWFSRANCGIPFPWSPINGIFFNESISWTGIDGPDYSLWTFSHHNLGGYALEDQSNWNGYHYLDSGYATTWRSYAGDTKSSLLPSWYVHGEHWLTDPYYGWVFMGFTLATGCNITEW